jgi:hypothetical protein
VTENQAPGRVSGKYLVIGLGAFGVVFFGVMLALALRLTPAAERFHNPPPATAR